MRILFFYLLTAFPLLFSQTVPAGKWQGAIEIGATKLNITLHIISKTQAAIDIPQQGAMGLSLQHVQITARKAYFELPAGPGLAVFDGKVNKDEIRGSFTQGAAMGSFFLHPYVEKKPVTNKMFKSQEVTIRHDGIRLAGTLLTPAGKNNFPAVVLVTGSGMQNRDEEIFGFKIFKVIAESLATYGIGSLRYDDRGLPPSTGDFNTATTADFATDALAAVTFLRKKLGPKANIGILGHSEGAVIATLLAGQHQPLDFIVLMGGPAIRGDALLKAQSMALFNAAHAGKETIADEQNIQDQIFRTIRQNKGWNGLEQRIRGAIQKEINALPEKIKTAIPDVPAYVKTRVDAQMSSIRSPWMKWFINYDPATDMRHIQIPVLALFGGKDLQVPFDPNFNTMRDIFTTNKNSSFKTLVFINANHLFQKANSGLVKEYPTLKKSFVKGFLPKISAWILSLPKK